MYYIIHENNLMFANNDAALKDYNEVIKILPADYEPNKYIVVNNELVLNPEWEEIQLNDAKQNKIKENDLKRDKALNQGVEYKGVLFDSDTDQKANLLGVILTMNDEDKIEWFGMDNKPLECTKGDLINIGGLITALHSFCWGKNAEIKALINEAETIDAVNNIEINYSPEETIEA